MHYRLLGRSTLSISQVGFGCMSLKGDENDNLTLLHTAIDAGINFFDTADLYDKGMNETLVGKALAGKRTKVVLATKVGNQWRADGSGWDWNPRKEYIIQAVEQSLQRLQTDYIDLYQLHGGTLQDPVDETIEAFELLQQQGKILYYGISSIRPDVIREYVKRSRIVSVMMQYSLLDRRPEEQCLALLQQNNIGVLARGSVAKGLLVNKPPVAYLEHEGETVKKAAAAIASVAGGPGAAAQKAIQFVLQHPAVTSAVVGIRTATQLTEAISAGNSAPLTEEQVAALRQAVPAHCYQQHR